MLRINKLIIDNFGPYQNNQILEFPAGNGVTFVWGENGVGKTSLLNCIRFALWGIVYNRNYEECQLAKFVNIDAVEAQKDMSVKLFMTYNHEEYELTRMLKRRPDTDGKNDSDYEHKLYLKHSGSLMSQEDAEHFLNTVLPEKISRFYLFDGELLRQYENLLEDSSSSDVIKTSIENILGLPILEGANKNLRSITTTYQQIYTKVSAANDRTKKDSSVLTGLLIHNEELKKSLKEMKEQKMKLQSEISEIEDAFAANQRYAELLIQEKEKESQIEKKRLLLDTNVKDLKAKMKFAWSIIFDKVIQEIIDTKNKELNTLLSRIEDIQTKEAIVSILDKIVNDETLLCPVCNGNLSSEDLSSLREKLASLKSTIESTDSDKIKNLKQLLDKFSSFKRNADKESLIKLVDYINTIRSEISLDEVDLVEIKKAKTGFHNSFTDTEFLDLQPTYKTKNQELVLLNEGITKQEVEIAENQASIEKLNAKISKQSNADGKKASDDLTFCKAVQEIFEKAVSKFRDDLKSRVQADAEDIFTKISHMPAYTGLKINDNYGLEIVTNNGQIVPNRSAGYEQVVALSLVGALHKNAPISGPIIMDSTFQRIDPRHRNNTLKSLPILGEQIIVLAYPTEVTQSDAKDLLSGKYLKDIYLEQKSEFETVIK
mgnify:FL=1